MQNKNELTHHGILGQKWGVRRFQNKDGSLTNAGKKRAAKLEAEYEKVTGKKVSGSSSSGNSSGKKSIKDMTDDELIKKTNRLNTEKNFIEAQKNHIQAQQQLSALQPKKVNKGKELAEKLMKDVIGPKAVDMGVKYIEKKLGLKDNSLEKLKKEAEIAGYKKKIEEAKQAAYKSLENDRKEAEHQADIDKKAKEAKEAKKAEKYAEKENKKKAKEDVKSAKENEKSKFSNDDYVDGDFVEINKTTINNGHKFIENVLLLEDKSMKHSEINEIMDQNELYHYKYAYKKKVNGKWRYYYDNDNKRDKGFSIKNVKRTKLESNISIDIPGSKKSRKHTSTTYRLNGKSVSKDVYEHADATLFYKNEPVKDIAKRTIDNGKNFVEKTINKIGKTTKKWLSDFFD